METKLVKLVEIVAILAAYNLADSIGEIIERTRRYVDAVIVVSSASRKTPVHSRCMGETSTGRSAM